MIIHQNAMSRCGIRSNGDNCRGSSVKGKGETGAVSGPTEIIAGVSQPILTYTGMAGRTMQRAVGLTVERGLAAVTGHGKEDAGLPSGVVAEGLTEKLGGGGR